jgi:REP element-mobilizing transposase RayT
MTLPLVVGYFKMNTAQRINNFYGTPGNPLWQRNYYEHIIRGEEELQIITDYITTNPLRWEQDEYYPFVQNPSSHP